MSLLLASAAVDGAALPLLVVMDSAGMAGPAATCW
jgi:hypothetical protein